VTETARLAGTAGARPGATAPRSTDEPQISRNASRLTFLALAALMALAFTLLYRKGLGLTFFYDEWTFITERRGWSVDTFLEPHGEHLSLFPILCFKLLFVTVGLDDYGAYRIAVLIVHLLAVLLLFVLARQRVGDVLALFAAFPILFLGSAWEDLLWPFQLGYLGSIVAGLGMLIALDRESRSADAVAGLLLTLSLASSSIGISFAIGALVELLAKRDFRSRWLRVLAVPGALYGLWTLFYGDRTAVPGTEQGLFSLMHNSIPDTPAYVANAAAGAFGALTGLGLDWGRPLALAAVFGVAFQVSRGRLLSPRALGLLGSILSFWVLAAVFRAHLVAPDASRYLYFGALIIVLLIVELFQGVRLSPTGLTILGVVLALSAVANFSVLQDGSRGLQDNSSYVAPELGALELAGTPLDPSYVPDPVRAPQVAAGPYFEAVRDLGSPADSAEEIAARPEPQRQAADSVLLHSLAVALRRASGLTPTGNPPSVDSSSGGSATAGHGCVLFRPEKTGGSIDFQVPSVGLAIRASSAASVEVRLRQFAETFPTAPLGTVSPGTTVLLRVPPRPRLRPWRVRLQPSGPVTTCTLVAA
jgi:hypothetical protein